MTFELLVYILLCLLSVILCFINGNIIIKRTLLFSSLLIYIVVVRFSGFDYDISTYAATLNYTNISSVYYYREPFYWFLSYFSYHFFNYPVELNFIFFDIISFSYLYFGMRRFGIKEYYLLPLILFFPLLMGMQNIYRQFLAISFLFYSISSFYSCRTRDGVVFFLIAGLTHNAAFLFFPLIFVFLKKYKIIVFPSLLSIILAIPFFLHSKSSDASGLQLAFAYIVIIFTLSVISIAILNFKRKLFNNINDLIIYILVLNTILISSVFFMGSSQGERMGMFCLVLLVPFFLKILNTVFRNNIIVNFIFITFMILPTFLFSSSFDMLLSSSRLQF